MDCGIRSYRYRVTTFLSVVSNSINWGPYDIDFKCIRTYPFARQVKVLSIPFNIMFVSFFFHRPSLLSLSLSSFFSHSILQSILSLPFLFVTMVKSFSYLSLALLSFFQGILSFPSFLIYYLIIYLVVILSFRFIISIFLSLISFLL